jgi:hypothetical protein
LQVLRSCGKTQTYHQQDEGPLHGYIHQALTYFYKNAEIKRNILNESLNKNPGKNAGMYKNQLLAQRVSGLYTLHFQEIIPAFK